MRISLFVLLFSLLFVNVYSHGVQAYPLMRGAQNSASIMQSIPERDDLHDHIVEAKNMKVTGMESDNCPHCRNGGGKGAVMKANKGNWVPYEPTNLKKPFRHDAGLCGDPIGQPQKHGKGGPWGFPKSPITATYKTGSVVEFIVDLTTNHQGYFEYFLCDATKCGGDISEACFRKGHCHQLMREKTPHCEKAQSMECSPVDPAYPGRWYIGCRHGGHVGEDFVGGRSMRYHLPKGFSSKHAVLQWYWVTANSCNPPGFIEYFKRYPMEKWGKCGGDGGTIGGRNPSFGACGGKNLPEEFWNCADIEINESGKASTNRNEIEEDENKIEEPMPAEDSKEIEETHPKPKKEQVAEKFEKQIPEHKHPDTNTTKPVTHSPTTSGVKNFPMEQSNTSDHKSPPSPSSLATTNKKFPMKHSHIIQHANSSSPSSMTKPIEKLPMTYTSAQKKLHSVHVLLHRAQKQLRSVQKRLPRVQERLHRAQERLHRVQKRIHRAERRLRRVKKGLHHSC